MAEMTRKPPMMPKGGAMPKGPMRGRGMPVPKGMIKKGTFGRILKMVLKYYKWQMLLVFGCLIFTAAGSLVSAVYMQQVVDNVIAPALEAGGLSSEILQTLTTLIIVMVTVYSLVVLTTYIQSRIMAVVTQGMLYHIREEMFAKMQKLPIKYFDTHAHGDIMSNYTNDTDAVRQLIGQSMPKKNCPVCPKHSWMPS